jgi:hypothetical protein
MGKPQPGIQAPIALDPEATDTGAMERLFLLEATTPGMPGYIAAENLQAMRLMRQTIENRLKSPAEYGARGATSETDIVDLGGQFAGFGGYPKLDGLRLWAGFDHLRPGVSCSTRHGCWDRR